MESIRDLGPLFSTADAEEISFEFDFDCLTVRFVDCRGVRRAVWFPDVKLQRSSSELDHVRFRNDHSYEIVNSELVQSQGLDAEKVHHYLLCFNSPGVNLEVLSEKMIILQEADAVAGASRRRPLQYEYTFVSVKLRGGVFTRWKRDEYREIIAEHARNGWRLVQVFAPGVGVYGEGRDADLIFEREIVAP